MKLKSTWKCVTFVNSRVFWVSFSADFATFNLTSWFIVSVFYAYRHMRLQELQFYPRRRAPSNINSALDLVQLNAIRQEHNRFNRDLPFDIIGNDSLVDDWIVFGEAEGLLTPDWTAHIVELVLMGRGPANRLLMTNDAPKFQD